MKQFVLFLVMFVLVLPLLANNLQTVENPTAGLLSKGEARIHQKIFKNNGIIIGADVGLFESFQFGFTYGAENLVGDQVPYWYKQVGFKARFRIIEEALLFPAIAVGVDTQGHGEFHEIVEGKEVKRYDIKSKGAYLVASKNWEMLGLLGLDIGMNWSFEDDRRSETKFDIFAGAYKTIGQSLTVFADYTAGINDYYKKGEGTEFDEAMKHIKGKGRGYLNAALQVRVNEQFYIKLLVHDILRNKHDAELFDRSIMLDYRWFF
jgi:hypothetical protein